MEAIADIMVRGLSSQGQASSRGRNRESVALSQQTHEPEEPEEYTIHPNEARARGYTYSQEPPPPEKCQFCGRLLYHHGAIVPGINRVLTWFTDPEPCSCQQAQEYKRQQEKVQQAQTEAAQRRKEQERIQRRVEKLIKDSGIRGRFQNRTFERFKINQENRQAYRAAKRYADSFPIMLPTKSETGRVTPPDKERNGLFISGTKGTGKTHLAVSIANQLMSGGTPVICMTMIDLLARIKQTFGKSEGATEAEIMRIYEEVPLLIIDDIGTEQPTKWGITQIYAIINARYEGYMPTIITTNYSGADLIHRMTPDGDDGYTAEKTISRLQEMCSGIEMIGEDWRAK